jgi:hypothetical protein
MSVTSANAATVIDAVFAMDAYEHLPASDLTPDGGGGWNSDLGDFLPTWLLANSEITTLKKPALRLKRMLMISSRSLISLILATPRSFLIAALQTLRTV